MLGIPTLARSSVQGDCERCGREFDPAYLGMCSRCRALLCDRDLHGHWSRRLLSYVGVEPVCVACRNGEPAPAASPPPRR